MKFELDVEVNLCGYYFLIVFNYCDFIVEIFVNNIYCIGIGVFVLVFFIF